MKDLAGVQTVGPEAVDDPLEPQRDRGQHLLQAGQLGPDDVIQVQDLCLLAAQVARLHCLWRPSR